MKAEVKTKWLAALRSGEYKQAKGALRTTENTFCCLGVLCDLYAKENNKEADWKDGFNKDENKKQFLSEEAYLPSEVKTWSELSRANPYVKVIETHTIKKVVDGKEVEVVEQYESQLPIARFNDEGKSFKELADIIEAQL